MDWEGLVLSLLLAAPPLPFPPPPTPEGVVVGGGVRVEPPSPGGPRLVGDTVGEEGRVARGDNDVVREGEEVGVVAEDEVEEGERVAANCVGVPPLNKEGDTELLGEGANRLGVALPPLVVLVEEGE